MDFQKIYEMLNSPLSEGLLGAVIGAVVGSFISGWFILRQTRTVLDEERRRKQEDMERETKAVASALLWEIDDFYKLFVRDVCRTLKADSQTDFSVKSPTYKTFIVFEALANKVGLLDPHLVQGIIGYYGAARAYVNTMCDYGGALEQFQKTAQPLFRAKATTLLGQIKKSSTRMVPLTQTVCASLAARAGTEYTFDAP
jgi:hypothetical protein